MPFNKLLGIRIVRIHKDGVTIRCVVDENTRNGSGALHGGVMATMADAAMGIGLASHFGGRRPTTTTDLKINYLRPVVDGKVTARSHIVRVGKHLCVGRVEIRDAERRLAAAALVTYIRL
ncbi:MAG: PaaI family thioesterase [Bryobacteraceae bacterium]|jgi:uncharacterized protein (TIGR00369 family)